MYGWEFPPHNSGGLGVACMGLTRALSKRGMEIIFVMPQRMDISASFVEMVFADASVGAVRTIPVDSPLTPYVNGTTYHSVFSGEGKVVYGGNLFDEVERYRLAGAAIARREKYDIIYAHDWLSFGPAMEAKRISGKPLVVHVHATEFDRSGGPNGVHGHVYEIEKAGMEAADRVIAVSEYTKQIIVREYGIPESKVRVVHNGVDEATLPAGPEMRRMRALKEAGYKLVLFLGRLTLQKGPDYFLKAAKKVLEHNKKVMFIVSGSGDMDAHMVELTARLGISSNVIFTGFLTGGDRHEMYTAADLFVMPSVSEPFGITPLESMRLGTPVLISKQSGVSEVVQHALKADFWDIDEMTNKILAVVGSDALSTELSENGKKEAARLTWDAAGLKVEGIITQLVTSR